MSNRDKLVTIDLESRDFTRLHKYMVEYNPSDDARLFAYYGGTVADHAMMIVNCGDLIHGATYTMDEMMPQHDGMIIVDGEPQWFDFRGLEERILNHCLEDGGPTRMLAIDLAAPVMRKMDFRLDPIPEPAKLIPTRTPHRRDWEQRDRKRKR